MLNRRHLFGASAAVAVAALPAAVLAAPADPWDAFLEALETIHPDLVDAGERARDRGYRPDEMIVMMVPKNGQKPWLTFRHEISQETFLSFEDAN